jgi:ADP-heptose:LPS heptosyltransferase
MRVLVVRFSSLGDVILTTSVLSPLKEMGFSVDFLTFKPFGEILRNQPFVDRVLEVDRKGLKSISQIRSLAEELQNYEFGIDLHDVLRTKLLRRFLPFKTYVYKKKGLLRRLMVLFKPFKSKWLYVPELYATALKKAGIEVENPRPILYPNLKVRKEFKKKLPENLITLSPGARWETKRYPLKKFKEIVREVKRKGFHPVVVGGKEEESLGKELEGEGALNFCGMLTLSESLALISLTKGVISNDSAVVHMARALKVPVVSIFGPTHPAFGFAPYPDEGISITLNLPCSPCSLHGKTRCKEQICFNIPPKKVVDKLFSLLEVN